MEKMTIWVGGGGGKGEGFAGRGQTGRRKSEENNSQQKLDVCTVNIEITS